MFDCPDCPLRFASSPALRQHCEVKRHGKTCTPCRRFFVSESALTMHLRDSPRHANKTREVLLSPAVAASTNENTRGGEAVIIIQDHQPSQTSNPEAHYCQKCSGVFSDLLSLNQHLSHYHHWCFQCSKDFNSRSALSKHNTSLAHKPRELNCPFCSELFKSPSGVAHHIESGCHKITRHQVTAAVHALQIVPTISLSHRIEGPFIAPIAPEEITTFIATEASFDPIVSSYVCSICINQFSTLDALNRHLASPAHDQKEFRCPQAKCGKDFTLISGLVQHVESGTCGAAKMRKIEKYYEDLTAAFTGALGV